MSLPITNLVDAHIFFPSVILASDLLCKTLTSRCILAVKAIPILIRQCDTRTVYDAPSGVWGAALHHEIDTNSHSKWRKTTKNRLTSIQVWFGHQMN